MYRAVLFAACVASASAFAPMTALPRAVARGEIYDTIYILDYDACLNSGHGQMLRLLET